MARITITVEEDGDGIDIVQHPRLGNVLHSIDQRLKKIEERETQMAQQINTVTDLIAALDTATTRIANNIQNIMQGSNLSEADKARLQAEVDALNAMGTDPSNPIPTPTPA